MSRFISHHDAFVRKIFSDKQIAVDYFRTYLPSSISELLDLNSLAREPDTYLSDDLQEAMSDIIYSCKRKDVGNPVRICLLIEHKSYPDKYTPLQLGKYIFSALETQLKSQKSLSLIVPILLYHGNKKWEYRTLKDLFEVAEEALKVYLPNFEYIFHDLGKLQDKEIESMSNQFLAASFLALKYSFNKEWLEQNAVRMLLLSQYGTEGLQKSLIIYLFSRSELRKEMIDSLPEKLKNDVMNTLDIYLDKGRKEGIEIGEKLGLVKGEKLGLKKGEKLGLEKGQVHVVANVINNTEWDDEQIADVTGVSVEFVRKVRESLKK